MDKTYFAILNAGKTKDFPVYQRKTLGAVVQGHIVQEHIVQGREVPVQ
jgi:hypothetical protein